MSRLSILPACAKGSPLNIKTKPINDNRVNKTFFHKFIFSSGVKNKQKPSRFLKSRRFCIKYTSHGYKL
ncbi:hypothetical protein BGP_4079 [Beggiatoa sp. PS]|nr:hypothetical protein BGP_4079 [Beggiatoa sp. PS]